MGDAILIFIGVVIFFAIGGFLLSGDGEREEGAKIGAMAGCSIISSLLPTIFVIVIVVLIVKSCT